MIIVPRWVAIALFCLFGLSILFLGVYGYSSIADNPARQIETAKAQGERFLFFAIICLSIVVLAFVFFSRRTHHLLRELDRMIEISKYGDFSPELSTKKLGAIGERITLLHHSLNTLSEKRASKISAVSELAEFLVGGTHLPLLVTDVGGSVAYVSGAFSEQQEIGRSEILNNAVDDIYPEVPFHELTAELDMRNSPEERRFGGRTITFFPIRNRKHELSYVVWLFDRLAAVAGLGRNYELPGPGTRIPERIKRALAKRRRPR